MSTTAIFVELLVSGIQASIWITLFLLSLTGLDWITKSLPQLEKWETIVTILVFAGWYSLGIIVDRFAIAFFMIFNPAALMGRLGIVKKQIAKIVADVSRIEIATKAGDAYEYLEYFRSRARIVRATIFNSILTTIAAVIFVTMQCGNLGCAAVQKNIIPLIVGVGIMVFVCASITSGMLELAYNVRVIQAQETLQRLVDKK